MRFYQFKLSVIGIEPLIWRQVLVPATFSLKQLHLVIQACMDWEDYHLHSFSIDYKEYKGSEESTCRLNQLDLRTADVIHYVYDFGDNWEVTVKLEKIVNEKNADSIACCIAGERAGPLEDSGGCWGYQEKLDRLNDSDSQDDEEFLEWMGEDFNPEFIDKKAINAQLKELSLDN